MPTLLRAISVMLRQDIAARCCGKKQRQEIAAPGSRFSSPPPSNPQPGLMCLHAAACEQELVAAGTLVMRLGRWPADNFSNFSRKVAQAG